MSNNVPLVSIVIPVYNHEKYVEEALNSVLYQTYPRLEVIIIDDGSKDRSVDCVDKWLVKAEQTNKTGRSFTFIKQENRGAHNTINRGLSIAQGDYLAILNSDDIYDVQRFEKLVKRLEEEGGQFAFTAIKGIDDDGNALPADHPWRQGYENLKHGLADAPTVGFQLLPGNLAISTGNFIFSRKLYQRIGEFKNLRLAHDYDFLLRALVVTEPIFLDEELYLYRIHGDNTFSKLNDLLEIELSQIYRDYLLQVSQHPPENPQAPCHWYWPNAFSRARLKTNIEIGLNSYLTKPESSPDHPLSERKKQHEPPVKIKVSKKHRKISFITHELTFTGAPKVVADLAFSLKEKGYKVNVISLLEGPMRKEFESRQIPVYVLPKRIAVGVLYNTHFLIKNCYRLFASLLLLFKSRKITIGNTYLTGPLLTLISLLKPFSRLIWYIHESSPPSASLNKVGLNRKPKSFLSRAMRNPRFEFWFGSHNTRHIWESADFKGKTVYWSGIPICHSPAQSLEKPIKNILSVGTCSPRKGTHYLIEAFMMGVKEGLIQNDVSLTIIGVHSDLAIRQEYMSDLILQIAHSGLKDRIRLLTHIRPHQLEAYYQEADLYVQSSIEECMPLALFKAMSMGLPIVTTNVNGCVEAIEDDNTGYVCYPRNSRLLLNAILKAINNPQKSRMMGLKAKEFFNEKFCLEKNLEEVLQQLK